MRHISNPSSSALHRPIFRGVRPSRASLCLVSQSQTSIFSEPTVSPSTPSLNTNNNNSWQRLSLFQEKPGVPIPEPPIPSPRPSSSFLSQPPKIKDQPLFSILQLALRGHSQELRLLSFLGQVFGVLTPSYAANYLEGAKSHIIASFHELIPNSVNEREEEMASLRDILQMDAFGLEAVLPDSITTKSWFQDLKDKGFVRFSEDGTWTVELSPLTSLALDEAWNLGVYSNHRSLLKSFYGLDILSNSKSLKTLEVSNGTPRTSKTLERFRGSENGYYSSKSLPVKDKSLPLIVKHHLSLERMEFFAPKKVQHQVLDIFKN